MRMRRRFNSLKNSALSIPLTAPLAHPLITTIPPKGWKSDNKPNEPCRSPITELAIGPVNATFLQLQNPSIAFSTKPLIGNYSAAEAQVPTLLSKRPSTTQQPTQQPNNPPVHSSTHPSTTHHIDAVGEELPTAAERHNQHQRQLRESQDDQ